MMAAFTRAGREVRVPRRDRKRPRVGDRPLRGSRRSLCARRVRRRGAARRARIPDRRVPVAEQHARRRLGREPRRTGAIARRSDRRDAQACRPRLPAVDPDQRARAAQGRRASAGTSNCRRSTSRSQPAIDAVHVTSYADDSTGPTDSYAPHVVGALSRLRGRGQGSRRGAGDHVRALRARRGRSCDRRRQSRLRVDGSQAAGRPRPAEQARRRSRRRRPTRASTSTAASATST